VFIIGNKMLRRIFGTKRDETVIKYGENDTQRSSRIYTLCLVVP